MDFDSWGVYVWESHGIWTIDSWVTRWAKGSNMNLPVCSVVMTVNHNSKNMQINHIMSRFLNQFLIRLLVKMMTSCLKMPNSHFESLWGQAVKKASFWFKFSWDLSEYPHRPTASHNKSRHLLKNKSSLKWQGWMVSEVERGLKIHIVLTCVQTRSGPRH